MTEYRFLRITDASIGRNRVGEERRTESAVAGC